MQGRTRADDGARGSPRCPECGSVLDLRILELRDDGDGELLLLFDCPRNDFHTTLTYGDVVSFIMAEVTAKLTPSRRSPAP